KKACRCLKSSLLSERVYKKSNATTESSLLSNCRGSSSNSDYKIFHPRVNEIISIIPHSTLGGNFSQPYDDPRQLWESTTPSEHLIGSIISHERSRKASTIEGGGSTGDTSIGGGSGLHLAITAHQTDPERFNENLNNRGGGGGGVSVSCGGQSPPTPTLGKTLLNTSPNLLPITTATDTFNNLKNLVKIDKGSSPGGTGNNNTNSGGGSYRAKGNNSGVSGYKNNSNSLGHNIIVGSPTSIEERGIIISNGGSGVVSTTGPSGIGVGIGRAGTGSTSGYIGTGFNRNSVKIRQYDSDVSPRPRRTYQSDSSSSRYYNKNSDNLGQGPKSSLVTGGVNSTLSGGVGIGSGGGIGRAIIGNEGGQSGRGTYNADGSNNRRYNNNQNHTDGGGYSSGGGNRNINSGGGGNSSYRQQQNSRYDNSNNGQQQRSYGSAGYNNNHTNKSNYGPRSAYNNDGNVNVRSNYREDYGSSSSSNNYRDYDDTPRSRYNAGNTTNSLDRGGGNSGGRYKPSEHGTGTGHVPSALRQGGISVEDRYERVPAAAEVGGRTYNNRTPPIRGSGGNASASSGAASAAGAISSAPSSINSASSSSRGISPNSTSAAISAQRPTPSPTPPPPAAGRWVPPSLRPQHGLTQSEKNDAVFRKVRGILNKLTPEKFQELSDELLKLDLNSILILNGVILLIFDKALDEPKYSSMYAQLCKRLSEEAPSFEKDPNSSCTFLRLLIAVCRDKFNNRLKRDNIDGDNNNQFNKVHRPQAQLNVSENDTDEEERRHLAKQRMLGNVKFIGELHKLDMLSKNVLHQCIQELLEKKKKRSTTPQEMCEDMECLAQLLKTCGKNLDSEQGKELMNQYFDKLERRSKSTDYPPRIRFMLKDVIELRENNWIPRKVATTAEPVPIKQIRTDDDTIIRTPFAQRNRDMRNNDRDGDSWMNRFHINLQPGYNDMFSSLSVTGASPIVSPFGNNNSNRPYNGRDRNQGGRDGNNYNNRYNKHNNQNNGPGGNREDNRPNRNNHNMGGRDGDSAGSSQYGGGAGNQLLNSKELAPRFKRNLMSTNQDPVENLQMRPAANSLLFKAASQNHKLPAMLPISTPPSMMVGGGGFGSGNTLGTQNKEKLSNTQYPLLGTPSSHVISNTARPASTPSAEYTDNGKGAQSASLGLTIERNLKPTNSSPNFNAPNAAVNVGERVKTSAADKHAEYSIATDTSGDKKRSATPIEQLITKQGSVEKAGVATTGAMNKQKQKEKAFNKEEVLKKATAYVKDKFFYETEEEEDLTTTVVTGTEESEEKVEHDDSGVASSTANESIQTNKQLRALVEGFLDLKVPEKCMKDVCINIIMDVLEKPEDKYLDRVISFLQLVRKQCNIKSNVILEIFKQVINKMNEREALNPRIATHVAGLLSRAVGGADLLKLTDIANYTDNGQHYPLFLLVLQQLHKSIGKEALADKFLESKIDLMNSLPEVDRNKARLGDILDDRNLAFLYPLLKVQAEMWKQMMADPTPASFYKWIKSNVDAKYYKDIGFINALMTVLVKYITQETTLAEGTDTKKHPDRVTIEKEEQLLLKYCQILQTFLGGSNELQLIAIYALQVFCYNENFPKGMLCRWFKYLYEAEVIEEETFVLWKEEISDKYPGKGTALFQVNNWLTWLQEAESEDDDD
ncbi:eukaryotic translation initiation factor 4 gamma 2, partial [Eurosta solidaginis]|uniref:eukaryotic translation initiation factor 4 gamma 2 n=1 Tax=Eurosta solidaginis TaxID=178769 RepID=UPI0035307238